MYFEAREERRTVDALVLPDLENTDPSTPCRSVHVLDLPSVPPWFPNQEHGAYTVALVIYRPPAMTIVAVSRHSLRRWELRGNFLA